MFREKCLRGLRPNLRDLSLILSETALAAERELLSSTAQNIIIKRVKKVSGEGHHGGAWKVAYADFVTAMMAFFLLMWLLNATTEDQRKGIADYFNASIPISQVSAGGSGNNTWTVYSGQLPAGLTLTSQGQLSGTPTVDINNGIYAGTFTFIVRATDVQGGTDEQTLSIELLEAPTGSGSSAGGCNVGNGGGAALLALLSLFALALYRRRRKA